MANQVLIRKAILKDLNKFFKFFSQSINSQFPEYTLLTHRFFLEEDYSKESFKRWLKKNKKLLLLATIKGKIVGYLLAELPYGGVACCNWIAVDDRYQGQGIGSSLLKEWEKEAREQGAHKLHLWADKRNIEFYKNCSFVLIGQISDCWFGADDYLFIKTLAKPKEKNYLREFLKKQKFLK